MSLRRYEGRGCCERYGRPSSTAGLVPCLVEEDNLGRGEGVLRARRKSVIGRFDYELEEDGVEVSDEVVSLCRALLSVEDDSVELIAHVTCLVVEGYAEQVSYLSRAGAWLELFGDVG